MKYVFFILLMTFLVGCGEFQSMQVGTNSDNSILRSRAYITLSQGSSGVHSKATASVIVTYLNPENVTFTIDTSELGTDVILNGNTLDLGLLKIASLNDNKLRVCPAGPPGPGVRCSQAAIRVYTTGSIPGFINISDGDYGVPLLVNELTTGLTSSNSVDLVTESIASNQNRLRLSDLSEVEFPVTADFSNAGQGNYEVTLVVEYVLRP